MQFAGEGGCRRNSISNKMKARTQIPSTDKLTAVLSGVAGEYFVAAELSRRGFIASITLRNSRGVDIQVTNADASHSVTIQVKTNQGSGRGWLMNSKAEGRHSKNHFYVFVNLNGLHGSPDYFVVPSKKVSDYITKGHAAWLKEPGRDGQKHNDSNMRKFADPKGAYLDRWELLGF
jgi:hypothetical protein